MSDGINLGPPCNPDDRIAVPLLRDLKGSREVVRVELRCFGRALRYIVVETITP